VATGVLPYAHIPAELADLPADLVTHTRDHHDLARFKGRKVAVLGAGQSAMETAALLHENGVDTVLVVRGKSINFVERNPDQLNGLGRIKRPATKLCEGWHCAFWNTPSAFRFLPQDMRITKARTVLGPSGSWWLKDRIEGQVEVLTSRPVREAVAEGSGVQLRFASSRPAIDVDHVIAGTGFRIDLARLGFLPDQLRVQIGTVNGFPVVSRNGESSVPGLYFTGAPTAVSLGPSSRFMAGTHNLASRLAQSVSRRAKAGAGRPVASGADDQMLIER
jgi:thioredoxin reductase